MTRDEASILRGTTLISAIHIDAAGLSFKKPVPVFCMQTLNVRNVYRRRLLLYRSKKAFQRQNSGVNFVSCLNIRMLPADDILSLYEVRFLLCTIFVVLSVLAVIHSSTQIHIVKPLFLMRSCF